MKNNLHSGNAGYKMFTLLLTGCLFAILSISPALSLRAQQSTQANGDIRIDATISGAVTDESGQPVIGASVVVEGSMTGVTTGLDGRYSIKVNATNPRLSFSLVGYETMTVAVSPSRSTINITLKESMTAIDEVVVTALGLTRDQKSLGYSVSKIDNEAITNVVSGNWLSGLDGKVAGLNFDGASAGPGGSLRVTLRGESSLSPDNNTALFVVDGVPISNDFSGVGGSSYLNNDTPVDFGNGAADINPDDIESVSVLKGPAATALYGSRAGNGAIIITTKSGRTTKGLGITINSAVSFERAGFWPDFQDEYGAGNGGAAHAPDANGTDARRYYGFWSVPATESWNGELNRRKQSRYGYGPRYEGQLFYTYDSYDWATGKYTRLPWEPKDWYKGFFETGITYTNSISVDGSNGKGTSVRASIKDTRLDWIVPNTGYTSQNISLSLSSDLNKFIKVNAKVTYYRKDSDNLPTTGYSQASPLYALQWNVPSVPISSYRDEYMSGRLNDLHEQASRAQTNSERDGIYQKMITNGGSGSENPYRLAYEFINTLDRDRMYGNLSVVAKITPKLSLTLRTGADLTSDVTTSRRPFYTYGYPQGYYREQTGRSFEMNNDFLLTYDDAFLDDRLTLTTSFGGNNMVNNYDRTRDVAEKLRNPGQYMLYNSLDPVLSYPVHNKKSINSFYGLISLGWKDTYFLDITGRNDWSSTLAPGNNSYFYPSVSASVLLEEALNLRDKARWINMLKLRLSWANVGNDTDPYKIYQYYSNTDFTGSLKKNMQYPNPNIKPENVESWEVGLDGRFFNNRLTLDLAFYNNETTNQIIPVPTESLSGATTMIINAGLVRNRGIEIGVRVQPIKRKNVQWTISANWSKNKNTLVELAPSVDQWQMNNSTIGDRVYIYAKPGTELGRIYGYGFQRAPEGAFYIDGSGKRIDCSGEVVVDAVSGNPIIKNDDATDMIDHGSIYPDWKAGMSHAIRYKNLSLNMTFSAQWGGNTYSVTHFALASQGKLKNSLPGRYTGLIHEGVNLNPDGTYSKNQTITSDIVNYYLNSMYHRENVEMNTFDTSFLKFKEARLEYALPSTLLKKTKVIQNASIGIFATNIFCWTTYPQYDPEAGSMSGSSISRGIESGAYPMTRTYGVNVKITF